MVALCFKAEMVKDLVRVALYSGNGRLPLKIPVNRHRWNHTDGHPRALLGVRPSPEPLTERAVAHELTIRRHVEPGIGARFYPPGNAARIPQISCDFECPRFSAAVKVLHMRESIFRKRYLA